MESILENIGKLIKVKTIVTFLVLAVFAIQTLRGEIGGSDLMIVISMVVSFYFGTQHEKALQS